jgi:hypothetical protein
MKTLILLTALPFAMSHGCAFGNDGSGKVITENRTVSTFNGISLECHANVYFTQGDEQSVRVEAEDNIMSHIKTEVKNKSLEIKMDDEDFKTHETINVYITVKELCMLELAGSGKMIGKSHINCDDMSLKIAGSGNITADIRSLSVKISVSGSGNLDVVGATTSMDIKVAGSGSVNAKDLQAVNSSVEITGSGSSTINTKEELNVTITGSGGVKYLGEPAKLHTNITGSGSVSKI